MYRSHVDDGQVCAGALRPKVSFNTLMQASDSFSQVDRDALLLFARLLGALTAPFVVIAAAAGIALSR